MSMFFRSSFFQFLFFRYSVSVACEPRTSLAGVVKEKNVCMCYILWCMTSVNLTICVCRDVTRGAVKASSRFVEMEIRSNGNNTRQVEHCSFLACKYPTARPLAFSPLLILPLLISMEHNGEHLNWRIKKWRNENAPRIN